MYLTLCTNDINSMSLLYNDVIYYDIFSYIAEHLKWYFEDQHQPRVTGKIDIGEGSDVRLLKKVPKLYIIYYMYV